jgi:hypothetical protein
VRLNVEWVNINLIINELVLRCVYAIKSVHVFDKMPKRTSISFWVAWRCLCRFDPSSANFILGIAANLSRSLLCAGMQQSLQDFFIFLIRLSTGIYLQRPQHFNRLSILDSICSQSVFLHGMRLQAVYHSKII